MLNQDLGLGPIRASPVPPSMRRTVALPDRSDLLQCIRDTVAGASGPPIVVVITGGPGTGKTAVVQATATDLPSTILLPR